MGFLDLHMRQISTFLTVAECKSFSAAAEKLFISHTALTQQMNALEKDLGFKLFERGPRGSVLTEGGILFYEKLQQFLKEADEVIAKCRDINESSHHIRIANINDLYTFYLYAKFYQKFQLDHPEITMEFIPVGGREQIELCEKGRLDVGFYFGAEEPVSRQVLASRIPTIWDICILVSKDSPLSHKKSISADDLKGKFVYAAKSNMASSLFDDYFHCQECTIVPFELTMQNIYDKIRNDELIISPGQFAPLFPDLLFLPLDPPLSYSYYIIYRKESSRSVRTLVNAYLDYIAGF